MSDWLRSSAHYVTNLKTVLCLGGLTDSNEEVLFVLTNHSFYTENVAQVGVTPLVEGAHESYARLDGDDSSLPRKLAHGMFSQDDPEILPDISCVR